MHYEWFVYMAWLLAGSTIIYLVLTDVVIPWWQERRSVPKAPEGKR